jgi:Family of unknown function (DUF6368)
VGGSGAAISLRHALNDQQRATIGAWLAEFASPITEWQGIWEFAVPDVRWLGLPANEGDRTCTFSIAEQAEQPLEYYADADGTIEEAVRQDIEQTKEFYRANLGYVPEAQLWLSAECNSSIDDRIVGRMILYLAEELGGVIDMNGAIRPPLEPGRSYSMKNYPWHSLEEVSAFVHIIPGQVYEQYYVAASGLQCVSHLVDVAFFRAWLDHPNFHLIK